MPLVFKRKLEPTKSTVSFNGKRKVDLLAQALEKILKDTTTLDEVRYSLLKHAHENTKLSLSALDSSLERRLRKEMRSRNLGTLKTVGNRDLSAAKAREAPPAPEAPPERRRKRPREEEEEDPNERKKSVPEVVSESGQPSESAPEEPSESAPEEPSESGQNSPPAGSNSVSAPEEPSENAPEEPSENAQLERGEVPSADAAVPITVDKLPEEALEEYVEVTDEGKEKLPSGFEETKQEEETLGNLDSGPTEQEGKSLSQVMIESDFDNGGHDIMVIDNGGDVVKRAMMDDVIKELTGAIGEPLVDDDATMEERDPSSVPLPDDGDTTMEEKDPANVPLPDEDEDEMEEFPPKKQEALPDEDATMKDTPAVKKEEKARKKVEDIRNVIFQKIARDEREFMQAMGGTRMAVKSAGEGLFLSLNKTKKLKKEIAKAQDQQSEFVKERLALQEKAKNKRILELRLKAAADTVNSALEIYKNNADKIVQKIRTNPANRSLITSSYRDPDTFNEIKYLTDANGDLVINEATGAPYIASISAMTRDDAAKLIKQRRAVDGSDLPSNYYPIYGKQAKDYFSKHEYSFLGRQFVNGKKLQTASTPPNITGRIKELLNLIGGSIGIEDFSIKGDPFKQWIELETLKSSYDNYTASADYQYEQDRLALDQDGKLIDENAMASAAKILQNITAQQLIQAMNRGQAELGAAEGAINNEPPQAPPDPNADKGQEKGEVGEDEMDVEKNPEQMQKESVNLASWMSSKKSYNPPSRARVFEPVNFPAFGGDNDQLDGGIWV